MEEFPTDLVVLMDELSPIEFLKLAYYKMGKLNIESMDELTELDKVMCKAADISTKLKLKMISPALRERFFKLVAEKGLDKPPSLLSGCANEHSLPKQTIPSQKASIPSTFFQNKKQPTLFQNTSRPADVDPASFQKSSPALFQGESLQGAGAPKQQDSEPFIKRTAAPLQGMWDNYEIEADDRSVQTKTKEPPTPRRQYREQSDSPPPAYKSRSSSRPRDDRSGRSRRSRSPPSSYKSRGRSSSRPRMSESSRRSRSPPPSSSYGSTRSFSRFDSPQEDPKRDDGNAARKPGLSFSLTPRRKYPGGDKPPVKF